MIGAWVSDLFISWPQEQRMLIKHRRSLPDIVYILSRLTTGFFITSVCIYGLAPVGRCHVINQVQGWGAAFQVPMSSLLFFFRIRAVFHGQRFLIGFFGLMWLSIVATSLIAPFALKTMPIGDTGYCVNNRLHSEGISAYIIQAVYDTLVFVAITAKLLRVSRQDDSTPWWKLLVKGEGMGMVSRIMLQTGQIYYLATVGFTITATAVILSPSMPDPYADVFIPLNAFMNNVMVTRVYRQLKLELLDEKDASRPDPSAIEFRVRVHGSQPFSEPTSDTLFSNATSEGISPGATASNKDATSPGEASR